MLPSPLRGREATNGGRQQQKTATIDLPLEVKELILQHLASDFQFKVSLDPLIRPAVPPAFSAISASKNTTNSQTAPYDELLHNLSNLSLVSREWHDASAPFLWSSLKIGFPRSFEQLLNVVGGPQEQRDRLARILSNTVILSPPGSRNVSRAREVSRTRNLSRGRERFLSPTRDDSPHSIAESFDWEISDTLCNNGLLIRQLSFSDFRTHGLRRTVRQGSRERFVTPSRVLHLLRGTRALREYAIESALEHLDDIEPEDLEEGKLSQLGLTEYMDSSLTVEVMQEILLRGQQSEKPTIASISVPIKALDLCGCTSAVIIEAIVDFVDEFIRDKPNCFVYMQRLGLFGVSTLKADILRSFLGGFPSLTHIDLSRTQANDGLLADLAASLKSDLQAISLARCQSITGTGIKALLCPSTRRCVTANLRELSIAGNLSQTTQISAEELEYLLDNAPCFRSGKLQTLDLSSCPLNDDLLMKMPQSHKTSNGQLLLLGIAYCRRITIPGLAAFLENVASSVEVLDLTKSCEPRHPFGRWTTTPCIDTFLLHTLIINKVAKGEIATRLTNLRVIELEDTALDTLGGGTQGWSIVFGRGRRGWYVNTEIVGEFQHGRRVMRYRSAAEKAALLKLTDKGSFVADNFGWNRACPFREI